MFQIFLLKNPIFKRGLSVAQKICYLSNMTYWFFAFFRLPFLVSPLLFIFFNMQIYIANAQEFISYTVIYMTINMMMQNYLYGRVRWPWVSELYEYVQGVYLAKAIVSVIMSPRKPTFNVTAKGLSLENDHISELAWPFFVIWAVLGAGLAMAIWRYAFDPGANSLILVVGLWNAFNMIIAGVALGAVAERRQIDRHPPLSVNRVALLVTGDNQQLVNVKSVSAGGCGFEFVGESPDDRSVMNASAKLYFRPMPGVPKSVTVPALPVKISERREADAKLLYIAEFEDLRGADYYGLAELMFGDSEALPQFLEGRRKHKNLIVGSLNFIWWGLREPLRAIRYATMAAAPRAPASVEQPSPEPTTARQLEVALDARIDELRSLVEAGERVESIRADKRTA